MKNERLSQKADAYLQKLCVEIPCRHVGSQGNHSATDFFADVVGSFRFDTQSPEFECIDWISGGAHLSVNDTFFDTFSSPYSKGCSIDAPLVVVSTLEELKAAEISKRAVLLCGQIAQEPLMPKNFSFYNPEHHKRIIHLIEQKAPAAIISACQKGADIAGGLYPFPLIEDGDFDIPSIYMTEEEGGRLAGYAGQIINLKSRAKRIPSKACNVIARKGAKRDRRIVLCAHIDAKIGSPGAIDNAGGVTTLLLLGELLADYRGKLGIELVAINGEDYYSNPGEQQFLRMNVERFDEIILGINLDGVGYRDGKDACSLYDCPPNIVDPVRELLCAYSDDWIEGEPWFQGDHALFMMNGVPTLAITSEQIMELTKEIIHTPKDTPDLLDTRKLARASLALRELILDLEQKWI
jgi:aminopeptidase YwaD